MIMLIDPNANNAGQDNLWIKGKNDPFRLLLCNSQGKFRKWTKIGIWILFLISLLFYGYK